MKPYKAEYDYILTTRLSTLEAIRLIEKFADRTKREEETKKLMAKLF